jgi:4-hydroxy-3-methylbut-2-enyl diphosphate reductase
LPEGHFVAYDTICSRVANRALQLEQFAKGVDMVLFVSGRGSSNGHYLYEYCRRVQPNTRLVADVKELENEWFNGVESVGITGATSTPRWLMEAVASKIES